MGVQPVPEYIRREAGGQPPDLRGERFVRGRGRDQQEDEEVAGVLFAVLSTCAPVLLILDIIHSVASLD